MKITRIGPNEARLIAEAALAALKPVAEQFGLSVAKSGGNYSATSLIEKFEFALVGENGEAQTREARDFARFCGMFGLTADMLNKQFLNGGQLFTITGLNTKAPRFPVQARRSDGKARGSRLTGENDG